MSSEIKADLIKDKSGTKTLATLSSSSVTLDSSVVFPAGHIVQSVFNPTLANTDTGAKGSTSNTGVCDITGQITITSGNGVLIYCQAFAVAINSSNAFGNVSIAQGTISSIGTILSTQHFGSSSGDNYGNMSFWAFDSSPADAVTPDYVITIAKGSGSTHSVNIDNFNSTNFKFFMFEVKQ